MPRYVVSAEEVFEHMARQGISRRSRYGKELLRLRSIAAKHEAAVAAAKEAAGLPEAIEAHDWAVRNIDDIGWKLEALPAMTIAGVAIKARAAAACERIGWKEASCLHKLALSVCRDLAGIEAARSA